MAAEIDTRFQRTVRKVLDATNGWIEGWARCGDCAARWVAIRPFGCTQLECPECHHLAGRPERVGMTALDYDEY